MSEKSFWLLWLLSLIAFSLTPGSASAAGSCIDSQWTQLSSGVNRALFNNTCNETIELTIQSTGRSRRVCEVLRIESHVQRHFDQLPSCRNTTELMRGCVCENDLHLVERRVQ